MYKGQLSGDRQEPPEGGTTNRPARTLALLALVYTLASRRLIAHACANARKAGVREGMSLAEARALCPRLADYPYEPHKDLRSLRALARRMIRFSPAVGLDITTADPPVYLPAIFLDVTGCQRLYGGWANLLEQVAEDLDGLHFHHRLAIVPTPGAAWAVAAFWRGKVVPVHLPEKLRDTLAPLPVEALRIDPKTIATLHHLGLETIGQLLAIPRDQLPSRFGPQLLLRIDQAMGLIPEPIVPLRPETLIEACLEFDGVIDSPEIILRTVESLVDRICDDLARRGHGVRRLDLRLHRLYAPAITREVLFSRPSRNPKNVLRLLARAIEMLGCNAPGSRSPRSRAGVRALARQPSRPSGSHLNPKTTYVGEVPPVSSLAVFGVTRMPPDSASEDTNSVRDAVLVSIKRGFARLMPMCYDCAYGT